MTDRTFEALLAVAAALGFIAYREHREARYLAPAMPAAASRKRVKRLRKAGYAVAVDHGVVLRSRELVRAPR